MKVKYCSIKRVLTNYKWKYYLLLTIDGSQPLKRVNDNLFHPIEKGDVGLDIGTRTLAITTPTSTELIEICDKVERHSKKKALVEEKMIRSLFSTNPGTSTSTGTRLKVAKLPNKSKRYIKLKMQHRELIRHISELRRYQHTLLTNYIISLGDNIMVEKMDYHKMVQ